MDQKIACILLYSQLLSSYWQASTWLTASDLPSISKASQPSGYIGRKDGRCSATKPSCCEPRKFCPQYLCSPPVTSSTPATMTLKQLPGGHNYRSIGCKDRFHLKNIKISANGRTVAATVVNYGDSVYGRQPCANNVVDASPAVWEAYGISRSQFGQINVTWEDECELHKLKIKCL